MDRINNQPNLPVEKKEESQKTEQSGRSLKSSIAWATVATALSIGGIVLPLHYGAHVFSGKTIALLATIQWEVVLLGLLLQKKSKVTTSAPEVLEQKPTVAIFSPQSLEQKPTVVTLPDTDTIKFDPNAEPYNQHFNLNLGNLDKEESEKLLKVDAPRSISSFYSGDNLKEAIMTPGFFTEHQQYMTDDIKNAKTTTQNPYELIIEKLTEFSKQICDDYNIQKKEEREQVIQTLHILLSSNFNQTLGNGGIKILTQQLESKMPDALVVPVRPQSNDYKIYPNQIKIKDNKIIIETMAKLAAGSYDEVVKYSFGKADAKYNLYEANIKLEFWPKKNEKGEYKIQTSGTLEYKKTK